MSLSVGELTATLSVDDSKFTSGLGQAESQLDSVGKTAQSSSRMTSSSLGSMSSSADTAGESLVEVGKSSTRSRRSLDDFGKSADDVDTRAMGFRDGLTGLQDTMLGVGGIASGRLLEGFLSLGAGISDLGSSIYNGVIPALGSLRKRFSNARGSAGRFRSSLGRIGKVAGTAGAALGGFAGAAALLGNTLTDRLDPNIDAMIAGLDRLQRTGETSGEVVRVLGTDFNDLSDNIDSASDTIGNNLFDAVEGFLGINSGIHKDRQEIAALDDTLVRLVENRGPQAASRALNAVANKAGLSKKEMADLKAELPDYAAAREVATSKDKAATRALKKQVDAMKAATDPVFRLTSAVQNVSRAQDRYDKALAKYGPKSQEANAASLRLAKAVSGADAAARNSDLSFSAFQRQLGRWRSEGVLTERQADSIARSVGWARRQANAYQGDYWASVNLIDNVSSVMNTIMYNVHHLADPYISALGGYRASGGEVRAGETYIVGEKGPEIFRPSTNGAIVANGEAMASPTAVSSGSGGTQVVTVQFDFSGGGDQEFLKMLRKSVRVRGGNVQKVLGG